MRKTIDTLVPDIYSLFEANDHKISEENFAKFAAGCKEAFQEALGLETHKREPYLRMSALGTPPRKLWYTLKRPDLQVPLKPQTRLTFLLGHLIEQFGLFLVREAGHTVTDEQKEVVLNGVKGHLDCRIDGVLTDVKGLNRFNYNKFVYNKEDSFGYKHQISSYVEAEGEDAGGFLVFAKDNVEAAYVKFSKEQLPNATNTIEELRKALEQDAPPERCFEPETDGESGNLVLGRECNWCPFKEECWKDANGGRGLRSFKYKRGTSSVLKHFVHIEKEPRVEEVVKGSVFGDAEEGYETDS